MPFQLYYCFHWLCSRFLKYLSNDMLQSACCLSRIFLCVEASQTDGLIFFYQKRQSMCLNHLFCKLDIVHNLIRHHILKNLICLIRLNLRLPFHLYYRFNWLCKKSLKCLSNVMFQTTCFPSLKFLWRSLPKTSV